MLESPHKRGKEMRQFRNAGRGRTEQGALNRAVMEAIHRITRNEGDFVGAFRQNVIRVIGSYAENSSRTNTQTE